MMCPKSCKANIPWLSVLAFLAVDSGIAIPISMNITDPIVISSGVLPVLSNTTPAVDIPPASSTLTASPQKNVVAENQALLPRDLNQDQILCRTSDGHYYRAKGVGELVPDPVYTLCGYLGRPHFLRQDDLHPEGKLRKRGDNWAGLQPKPGEWKDDMKDVIIPTIVTFAEAEGTRYMSMRFTGNVIGDKQLPPDQAKAVVQAEKIVRQWSRLAKLERNRNRKLDAFQRAKDRADAEQRRQKQKQQDDKLKQAELQREEIADRELKAQRQRIQDNLKLKGEAAKELKKKAKAELKHIKHKAKEEEKLHKKVAKHHLSQEEKVRAKAAQDQKDANERELREEKDEALRLADEADRLQAEADRNARTQLNAHYFEHVDAVKELERLKKSEHRHKHYDSSPQDEKALDLDSN